MAPNKLGRFVWYDLMTTDLDAAKAFYTKVIGWGTMPWERPMSYTMWTHTPEAALGGLMALPEPTDDRQRQHLAFSRVRALLDEMKREGHDLDTLSMGMSGDLEAAIEEGSTMIRIGTAIFGART